MKKASKRGEKSFRDARLSWYGTKKPVLQYAGKFAGLVLLFCLLALTPVYQCMATGEGRIRLTFAHAEGGLVAKPLPATYDIKTKTGETAPLVRNSPDSELEGFATCGADHKWVWASAKIDGDSVVVWSDKIPEPVAVRYAWADNPACNLYNKAGFPASPFRTDSEPGLTLHASY